MIESIVVSREMGEKLKAAGWTKPTHYKWRTTDNMLCIACDECISCPAPTAEEILAELPDKTFPLKLYAGNIVMKCFHTRGKWVVRFTADGHECRAKALSEAAAQMWLWCVEKGHIKPGAKP